MNLPTSSLAALALLAAANTSFILQGDPSVFDRARRAVRERLGIACHRAG